MLVKGHRLTSSPSAVLIFATGMICSRRFLLGPLAPLYSSFALTLLSCFICPPLIPLHPVRAHSHVTLAWRRFISPAFSLNLSPSSLAYCRCPRPLFTLVAPLRTWLPLCSYWLLMSPLYPWPLAYNLYQVNTVPPRLKGHDSGACLIAMGH